jgi:hypothetical protein
MKARNRTASETFRLLLEAGCPAADSVLMTAGAQCCVEGQDEEQRVLLGLIYGMMLAGAKPVIAGALLETFAADKPQLASAMRQHVVEMGALFEESR